jgi:hypothetical protein
VELNVASSNEPKFAKTFAWRNLASGALAVAFWRLDQLQETKRIFKPSCA